MPKLLMKMMLIALTASATARADGPTDNIPEQVRRIPPPGIEVPADARQRVETGLEELDRDIRELRQRKNLTSLLTDVLIFRKAVGDALEHHEFFAPQDIDAAEKLIDVGHQRALQLIKGQPSWTEQTGLVVRGYVSRIDGSVQPYGLVIPDSYSPAGGGRYRLDVWFHGRGETLSEVKFLDQRMKQVGQYAPADTIVLHPYGRYSNAFKFAGEVDVLEAIEDVKRRYRIDEDRISVRGFSMGGAACWQFAVHFADRWFAANPGAGFAETPEFLKFFQKETLDPTWYERRLWHWYDCTDYAVNLSQCPTVAYSGELDIQKQAADIMQQALLSKGIDLVHVVGPQTKHAIHPDSKIEIERRMDQLATVGRRRVPLNIRLETYTLKYNRMNWLTINALEEHWRSARVEASILPPMNASNIANAIFIEPHNVTDFTIDFQPGEFPREFTERPIVVVNSAPPEVERAQSVTLRDLPLIRSDRSWTCRVRMVDGNWVVGAPPDGGLQKVHNLQGPIDDAFMDSFVFVRPTGKSESELVESWTRGELAHAIEHWRLQFRGDARVKDDTAITDDDIAHANLVLFGDATSNSVLKRIADKLPIRWNDKEIVVGQRRFDAADHAAVLIYPNPLNPRRYVVLNSGFTYREYDYLNNARQVPKLPDWAIVDLHTPPNSRWPGKIVDADFFDELWQLRPPHKDP